jgi:hypothetical protein
MTPTIAGLVALAAPLFILGLAFLRKRGAIFAFYLALCAVGLGYLTTTGAVDDIGTTALDAVGGGGEPAPAPAPTP